MGEGGGGWGRRAGVSENGFDTVLVGPTGVGGGLFQHVQ